MVLQLLLQLLRCLHLLIKPTVEKLRQKSPSTFHVLLQLAEENRMWGNNDGTGRELYGTKKKKGGKWDFQGKEKRNIA